MKDQESPVIGFIGQGYVGKSYADDFEVRGFTVVRYAQEAPYIENREKIRDADVVFIAVPTPTKNGVFDDSILRSVVPLVGAGKIAIIKSTMVPGTTESIQDENPDVFVMHSPEFLSEKTALEDARTPRRNIIGIPRDTDEYRMLAKRVLALLPQAPFELICGAREAEIIKYANNAYFYSKIVFMNVLYDLAKAHDCSWENIRSAMAAEPWIGTMHIDPVHKSGRGAGGACFVKDFAAFRASYEKANPSDGTGNVFLRALEAKNFDLLKKSGKDQDLLRGVYGEE